MGGCHQRFFQALPKTQKGDEKRKMSVSLTKP